MNWTLTQVAKEGTHHLLEEQPAYEGRFDHVLPFHSPGLAPVKDSTGAYHINLKGEQLYEARYLKTFGFYEGCSSVQTLDGEAFHIDFQGEPLYSQRFDWCGNFQQGWASVRRFDGQYQHISSQGQFLTDQTWSYVGDFREGAVVAQRADGRHSHLNLKGKLLNDHWYLNLGVFHKGIATAEDEQGWHHIDKQGRPLYDRRFKAVEDFYNEQARVEQFDGALLVIDFQGTSLQVLREPTRSPFESVSADLVSYWRSFTLKAAVELGVFEAFPGTASSVSLACGISLDKAEAMTQALWELGYVKREHQTYRVTEKGALLHQDHQYSLSKAALTFGHQAHVQPWQNLSHLCRGDLAGYSDDRFKALEQDVAHAEIYHQAMLTYAKHDYEDVGVSFPGQGHKKVIDVAGGSGELLKSILKGHPHLQGVLLDRPSALRQARLPESASAIPFDLFEPWPVKGDAILLARVLHDWSDAQGELILKKAFNALEPGGRLYLLEMLLDEDSPNGRLLNLHMVAVNGGQERTKQEFVTMLEKAGFGFETVQHTGQISTWIIAKKEK